ncbi:MAG TPA: hypothetical protein VKA15_27405 [Isosphaeraceae bacterium]|nr:hypothetical protein [Isosphaeraceae bacterium]
MPRDVARDALYNGEINLWVEDDLTRAYLGALWNDSAVKFLIGGGRDGVGAILKDADDAGYTNVFGLTDRDFRPSNVADWTNPAKTFRKFVLPVHEVENYLLDASALQASRYQNRGLQATAIEARMVSKSQQLCWWAACRDVIAELKQRFSDSFVPDPKQSVIDEATARAHICESPWFRKLPTETGRSSEADVHALLGVAYAAASGRLADGSWRQEFAGKEILRDVAGWMCDRTVIPKFPSTDMEFYSDLAKAIAGWQVANNAVPIDLAELLAALKARVAPAPSVP